jgi:hypothetical protein
MTDTSICACSKLPMRPAGAGRMEAAAFLAFIERDMTAHPERIVPLSASKVARAVELTRLVVVSDEDDIPSDVTFWRLHFFRTGRGEISPRPVDPDPATPGSDGR